MVNPNELAILSPDVIKQNASCWDMSATEVEAAARYEEYEQAVAAEAVFSRTGKD